MSNPNYQNTSKKKINSQSFMEYQLNVWAILSNW
ncbi:hypothetical protein CoNPh17_CDS0157 [Staphylococcus phage S-CoN_Ph17]|nr:hypothetical protein CoNPh17_CDS0157 [Staphylococcus phage S-CoN_Ph17]